LCLIIFLAAALLAALIAMLGNWKSQNADSAIWKNNAAQHAGAVPEQMSQSQQAELIAMAIANGAPPEALRYRSMVRQWAAMAPAQVPQHVAGDGQMGSGPIPPGQPLTAQQEVMAWACAHRAPEWVAVNFHERELWVAAECTAGRANLIMQSQPVQAAQPEVRKGILVAKAVRRALPIQ
jgi:hypothetical protein